MCEKNYVTNIYELDRKSELYSSSKSVWCRSEFGSESGSQYTDALSIIYNVSESNTCSFKNFVFFLNFEFVSFTLRVHKYFLASLSSLEIRVGDIFSKFRAKIELRCTF